MQGKAADALRRTRVQLLPPAQRALLGSRYGRPLPVPPCLGTNLGAILGTNLGTSTAGAAGAAGALRPRADWAELQGRFASEPNPNP